MHENALHVSVWKLFSNKSMKQRVLLYAEESQPSETQCNLFTDALVSNTASLLALVISNHMRLLSGKKKLAVHKV